jgi:hypothetical protein
MYRLSTLFLLLSVAACGEGVPGNLPDANPTQDAGQVDADPGCTADVSNTYYADTDGDGYGSPDLTAVDCSPPVGFVENDLDCDDRDSLNNPDGTEVCDGLDNDCNEATVEVCPNQCTPQKSLSDGIYLFCATGAAHAAAQTICEGERMNLVRIDSMEEQVFVADTRVIVFGNRPRVWIGGSDAATENTWLWADGEQFWAGRANGVPVGGLFTFWNGGEPNDDGTEDCAHIRDNNSGDWNDVGCGEGYRFVCERAPETL